MIKAESFKFANFIPAKNTLHFVQNLKHHPSRKSSFNVKFQKFGHFSCRFSTSSTKLGEIKLCKLDDKASPDPWLNCFCLLLDFFFQSLSFVLFLFQNTRGHLPPPISGIKLSNWPAKIWGVHCSPPCPGSDGPVIAPLDSKSKRDLCTRRRHRHYGDSKYVVLELKGRRNIKTFGRDNLMRWV